MKKYKNTYNCFALLSLIFSFCYERGDCQWQKSTSYKSLQDSSYTLLLFSLPIVHDTSKIKYVMPFYLPGMQTGLLTGYFVVFKRLPRSVNNYKRLDTIKEPSFHVGLSKKMFKHPLITVHGNVLYDMNYRSHIDTPLIEKNLYQHAIQTNLDITFKDQYPIRLSFNSQFNNSSFLRDFTSINFQFDQNDFKNRISEQVKSVLLQSLSADSLQSLKVLIEGKTRELISLRKLHSNPSGIQKLIEEREEMLLQKGKAPRSFPFSTNDAGELVNTIEIADTLKLLSKDSGVVANIRSYTQEYDRMKQLLDSMQIQLQEMEKAYRSGKELLKNRNQLVRRGFDNPGELRMLRKKITASGIPDSLLPRGYKILWAVKSFGIGRNIINYSELSARNLSITGLQMEYNPGYYLAFASGVVDYRFRDYIIRNDNQPKQYVSLVRVGKGMKEGNNVILTFFNGRRQLYSTTVMPAGVQVPNYRLMGFTVEGQFKLDHWNLLTAEVAKSSRPYNSLVLNSDKDLLSTTFEFKDRSNEAYALKISSFFRRTQTRINAFYRHYGTDFQSFSVFTTGSQQRSWAIKADQPFFKRQLTLMASVRSNDFSNPFVERAYSSSTVFKSLQATYRRKRWPVISLGYYPSSQITKMSSQQFSESLFYTLNANVSHFYKFREKLINTSIVYTRFYNKATDSNFIYYNTGNLLVSHNMVLGKVALQCNVSGAINTEYEFYTLENTIQYKINQSFSLGGGLKYNRQTVFNREILGYSSNASFKVPKLGDFQFLIDKGFVPGANKELVENNIGRFTFFKVF